MVVKQINICCIGTGKTENDPPIARDSNGVKSSSFAFQGMEPIAGEIHIRRYRRLVEGKEYAVDPVDPGRIEAASLAPKANNALGPCV